MNPNCNLDLCLLSPSSSYSSPPDQKQKLTIFYNGNINVCDVTDLQAREIITVARREADRIRFMRASLDHHEMASPSLPPPFIRPAPAPAPICSDNNSNNNNGLSMHRSLHRFLQMRKNRIQSASPYAAH
ncbi:protein TIFY 5B-like [Impatiens glandulifera]|uniref:protein TIFY 5B-like n=1 Tax=Impatiens glandulifera TaxID=253017 RepID=UPI001FB1806A|nr:protein TIFY 5B-like [Impatiens glandulifera]